MSKIKKRINKENFHKSEFLFLFSNIIISVVVLGCLLYESIKKTESVMDTKMLVIISFSTTLFGVLSVVFSKFKFVKGFIIVTLFSILWVVLNFFVGTSMIKTQENKFISLYIVIHIIFQSLVGFVFLIAQGEKKHKKTLKNKSSDALKQKLVCFISLFIVISSLGMLNSDNPLIDCFLIVAELCIGFGITTYYSKKIKEPMVLYASNLNVDVKTQTKDIVANNDVILIFNFKKSKGKIPDTYTIELNRVMIQIERIDKNLVLEFTEEELAKTECKIVDGNFEMKIAHTISGDTYHKYFSSSSFFYKKPNILADISYNIVLLKNKNNILGWLFNETDKQVSLSFISENDNFYINAMERKP